MKKLFGDLRSRCLLSVPILAAAAILIFYSYDPRVECFIALLIMGIASVGIWEYSAFCQAKGLKVFPKIMMCFGVLEILAIYLNGIFTWAVEFPIGVLLLAIFSFSCLNYHKIDHAIATIATQFFSICYIAVPLGLMLKILYPGLSSHFTIRDGRMWLIYLIVITKVADIGAYFGGKLIGKRKLAPVLSPKKTIEGAVVGFVIAVLFSLLFSYLSQNYMGELFELPWLNALLLGGILGIGGQLGDLSESLLKRDAKVKDSNHLPGFGGILDLFDSLLFTIPLLFFYLHTV